MNVNPADAQLIEQIQKATHGGATLLCTLARRGKAFERDNSERAAFLLAVLRPHPLYKGGRLAFDMLEIEDLILDAVPADLLNNVQLSEIFSSFSAGWRTLAEVFQRFGAGQREDGRRSKAAGEESDLMGYRKAPTEAASDSDPMLRVRFGPRDDPGSSQSDGNDNGALHLDPELRSSDYLYDYVVLGLVSVLSDNKKSGP